MPRGKSKAQTVKVVSRPAVVEDAFIPEPLKALFEARGQRVSLISILSAPRVARHQRYPLRSEDIEPEVRENMVQSMKRAGFSEKEGFWRLGDTALFIQPIEAYRAHIQNAYDQWQLQMGTPKKDAEAMADKIDSSVRHGVNIQPIEQFPHSFSLVAP